MSEACLGPLPLCAPPSPKPAQQEHLPLGQAQAREPAGGDAVLSPEPVMLATGRPRDQTRAPTVSPRDSSTGARQAPTVATPGRSPLGKGVESAPAFTPVWERDTSSRGSDSGLGHGGSSVHSSVSLRGALDGSRVDSRDWVAAVLPGRAPGEPCLCCRMGDICPHGREQVIVCCLELELFELPIVGKVFLIPLFQHCCPCRGRGGREGGSAECVCTSWEEASVAAELGSGLRASGHGSLHICQGPWPPRAEPGPLLRTDPPPHVDRRWVTCVDGHGDTSGQSHLPSRDPEGWEPMGVYGVWHLPALSFW